MKALDDDDEGGSEVPCEAPGVDKDPVKVAVTDSEVPCESPGNKDPVKVAIAGNNPEIKVSKISAAKEMDIKNDTYNVMFKKVDHYKLGARPKVKMKKPAPELINLKPTEPERKSVRSRDIVNKFEQLVKDDKKNCQEDKNHEDKNDKKDKTNVNSSESGLKSVVKGYQILKDDHDENVDKSEGDELNKLRFGREKPEDFKEGTQLNLTPIRGRIKLGNVAKLKDGFDKLIQQTEGENLPNLKRLKQSSPLRSTSNRKVRKGSRSSAVKKAIVDANQPSILDFYRGKQR